jgi:lipid-binding SYLF domain-containing protein
MNWTRRAAVVASLALMVALPIAAEARPSAAELTADGQSSLNSLLSQSEKARLFNRNDVAVLVFPKILKAGFMIGAQTGDGVLLKGGRAIGFYNISAGSFGLQAGGQVFSYALFFMNQKSLDYLRSSDGWSVGTGPSIVVIDKGKAMSNDTTTITQDVYAFPFGASGLMAGLGIQGSKITPIHPK